MSASQNIFSVTVRQQDSAGVDIIGTTGRVTTYSYAGLVGQYSESFNVPTAGVTPVLPASPCLQFFMKNLDPTNYVTVTWTPNGGASNIVKVVRPGGFLAFSDLDNVGTSGITALTLQANTAPVKVELWLAG